MAFISKTKSSLILALLAALILLMSRDVAARHLAETTTEKINKGEVATGKAKAKVGESKYYFGDNGNGGNFGDYGNGGNGNGGNNGGVYYGDYGNGGNGNSGNTGWGGRYCGPC